MADTTSPKPVTPGSPRKRVTMSAGREGSRSSQGNRGFMTPGTPVSPDYSKPIVRSAVRRWKRLHEQKMMEKLVKTRNEKKQSVKLSRDDARKVARKIPVEVLARDWLNDNEASLEVRAYLVDKVLPTLILGVEKLLNEADKRGLLITGEMEPNFNPINFLAQYLMRNNPRYSNFSESSPYVRGLREVADELKRQLFNIEDNRLARIKAEAKRRREERDRQEQLKLQERERREKAFISQFADWSVHPDDRVEMSLVQNALRSFAEIAENFQEPFRTAAKLSHSLEPTDESGKMLLVIDFAKYLSMFVEDLSKEIFEEFMGHLAKCASSHRAAANRESRRILLTNLFISCDHSGIGLLDRHRILSLFETFWDSMKDDLKKQLRNPRRWPVAEVDEIYDDIDDEEDDFLEPEKLTEKERPPPQQTTLEPANQEEKKSEPSTDEPKPDVESKQEVEDSKPPVDNSEGGTSMGDTQEGVSVSETVEQKEGEKPETVPQEQTQKTEEEKPKEETQAPLTSDEKPSEQTEVKDDQKEEKVKEEKTQETKEEVKEEKTEEKKDVVGEKTEEKKDVVEEKTEEKKDVVEEKTEEKKDVGEEKIEEKKDVGEEKTEEKKDVGEEKMEEKKDVGEEKTEEKKEDIKEEKKDEIKQEKTEVKTEDQKTETQEEKAEEQKEEVTQKDEASGEKEEDVQTEETKQQDKSEEVKEDDKTNKPEGSTVITETNQEWSEQKHEKDSDQLSITFAQGTTFQREKTALTQHSAGQWSAFDESSLNVSQFVQLTETFLGDEPSKETFDTVAKFIKGGYEETEEEKMERLMKARKEALSSQRKVQMDSLFEKWDNDGAGYLDLDEVETVMQKYKEGQEVDAIHRAKASLKKQAKYSQDSRLSRREFRQFIQLVVDEMPGSDAFDYFIEFLTNSVERTYAERIRGEARKKWLQQIVTAAETGGSSMEPVYRTVFQALYKDSEAHGAGKRISSNIAMLERNKTDPKRGNVCLRYVSATVDDADFMLGKILYQDMKGISFAAVESGKPIHVPRVNNHGNVHFWNPYRLPEDREGSFIVVPLKDKRKRVFGLLGIDTLNDHHSKTIFITHEIQFFQGVANAFSISYHHIDMRKKLLRITESAVSWIHRRSPHVHEVITYMVEPDIKEGKEKENEYILRKMMTTDAKGNVLNLTNPPRLERKDNLFRDYLFKCVDNSESVSADAYGQRHLGFPLRDDNGRAAAVVDISIGELKSLPSHENKEVQRMLRLLQLAHKEITREFAGDDKMMVLEAEQNDDSRMDIMFDRLMLMELRENVAKIDTKSFAELRSYNDPPHIVRDIVKAVCAIFHFNKAMAGELDDWVTLRAYINNDLLQKIEQYDPTSTKNQDLIPPEKIEAILKDVPHGEVGKFGSIPAQNMYNWVFVCISLIEHTIKMRANSDDVVTPGQEEETTQQADTQS